MQKGLQRNRIIKSIEKIEWCSKYEAHVIVIVGGGGHLVTFIINNKPQDETSGARG